MSEQIAQDPVNDRVVSAAPLGLRFWDLATGEAVADRLRVEAHLPDDEAGRVRAKRAGNAAWVFDRLPGDDAAPISLDDLIASHTPSVLLVIDVEDLAGRFVPVRLRIASPRRGVVPRPGVDDPPAGEPSAFVLRPVAGRAVPQGLAGVRMQLNDAGTGGPARHALVDVTIGGPAPVRAFGVSDETGAVLVLSAHPSPPAGDGPRRWPVVIRVRYQRLSGTTRPGLAGARPVRYPPEFEAIRTQASAGIFREDGVVGPELAATLESGVELVLRTRGHSMLMVQAV